MFHSNSSHLFFIMFTYNSIHNQLFYNECQSQNLLRSHIIWRNKKKKAQASIDHFHQTVIKMSPRTWPKSRRPFSEDAQHLTHSISAGVSVKAWFITHWKEEWLSATPTSLHSLTHDPEYHGPRAATETGDNRLRKEVGRFGEVRVQRLGLMRIDSSEQTIRHIIEDCSLHCLRHWRERPGQLGRGPG